jgi:hypothetical protein
MWERFFHTIEIMMPLWFPWIVVGGLLFTFLGFVGSKYKEKVYKPLQSLQDFISGSILVAFTGVLMPDLFPAMELPAMPWNTAGGGLGGVSGGGLVDDVDLQVGPPRLIRG